MDAAVKIWARLVVVDRACRPQIKVRDNVYAVRVARTWREFTPLLELGDVI